MKRGIAALILGYVLSQFYRAFLAVLSPFLAQDLGLGQNALAQASGWWFFAFAAMQIPVGWALDRFGPRWTTTILLVFAALGAAVFAGAQTGLQVNIAMTLIGIGCSPVLMAAYFIFARSFSPQVFGSLAGMMIGLGSFGNIASTLPLTWAVSAMGWRTTMAGLALLTLLTSALIGACLRDPPKDGRAGQGSLWDLLKMPALWPILVMMACCYAPPAGMRGLWSGTYLADVHGADPQRIGMITLAMGIAMIVGNFAYGPLDRLFGTRKGVVFAGNLLMLAAFVGIAVWPAGGLIWQASLLVAIGLFGSSFPMVMAHGRAFLPPHLVGRGVTLLNLFGIGSAGLMQFFTGRLFDHLSIGGTPNGAYTGLFTFYAGLILLGLTIYLFAKDRTD